MATNIDFTPKKRKKKDQVLSFTLGLEPGQDEGDEAYSYEFRSPKQASMYLPLLDSGGSEMALITGPFKWMAAGLSEEDMERILDRLRDPEDDLDIDFMQSVINRLTEETSKRPTK